MELKKGICTLSNVTPVRLNKTETFQYKAISPGINLDQMTFGKTTGTFYLSEKHEGGGRK